MAEKTKNTVNLEVLDVYGNLHKHSIVTDSPDNILVLRDKGELTIQLHNKSTSKSQALAVYAAGQWVRISRDQGKGKA